MRAVDVFPPYPAVFGWNSRATVRGDFVDLQKQIVHFLQNKNISKNQR